MRHRLVAVFAILALVSAGGSALAQRVTGTLVGTITDTSGAVLPGVTVSLQGSAIVGTLTSLTNEKGFYRIPALPPGTYTITFTLSGFATLKRENIRSGVGQLTEENVALKLSQMSETVTVESESAIVDSTTNQVSTNYNQEWVKAAPTPRFTFFDLINAAPGVAQTSGARSPGR